METRYPVQTHVSLDKADEALPADHYSAPQAYLEPLAVPDRGHSFSLPASQKTAPGFSADLAYLGAAPNGTTEDFDVRA